MVAPIYPGYITSVIKDTPFAVLSVLFLTLLVRIILIECTAKRLTALAICALLIMLARNNGAVGIGMVIIYILALYLKSVFIRHRCKTPSSYPLILLSVGTAMICYILYAALLLPALHIEHTSIAEALSIPFQQTARVVCKNGDDLSDEEQAIISNVLDYSSITNDYNPVLSDPVKNKYHGSVADLKNYIYVWFVELFKYPATYADAFFMNSLGFYYPDVKMSNTPVMSGTYNMIYDYRSVHFTVPDALANLRPSFQRAISAIENIPLLYPYSNAALNSWVIIYLLMYCIIHKNCDGLLFLIPTLACVLTCLISPTFFNNGLRYALPVIYCNLMLIGVILFRSGTGQVNQNGSMTHNV